MGMETTNTAASTGLAVNYGNLDFFLTLATIGGWIFVKPIFVLAGRGYSAAAANLTYRSKVRAVQAERNYLINSDPTLRKLHKELFDN